MKMMKHSNHHDEDEEEKSGKKRLICHDNGLKHFLYSFPTSKFNVMLYLCWRLLLLSSLSLKKTGKNHLNLNREEKWNKKIFHVVLVVMWIGWMKEKRENPSNADTKRKVEFEFQSFLLVAIENLICLGIFFLSFYLPIDFDSEDDCYQTCVEMSQILRIEPLLWVNKKWKVRKVWQHWRTLTFLLFQEQFNSRNLKSVSRTTTNFSIENVSFCLYQFTTERELRICLNWLLSDKSLASRAKFVARSSCFFWLCVLSS